MQTVAIKCDGCGNDLTYTGNCEDFRLALINERVPSGPGGGAVTCMAAYPAIDRSAHFCTVDCLRQWLDENYPAQERPYHRGKLGAYGRRWRKIRNTPEADLATPPQHLDQGND